MTENQPTENPEPVKPESETGPAPSPPRVTYRVMRRPAPVLPRPIMTELLVAINLAIYLVMELAGSSEGTATLIRFGALDRRLVWEGELFRIFTATFLHIGFLHLLSNMTALYLLGSLIESFYGRFRFLGIYLLSGITGNIVSTLMLDGISAGASGCILGLSGALLARISAVRGRVPERQRILFFAVIVLLIGFDVFLGLRMEQVNNAAHLGGLFAGLWLSYGLIQKHSIHHFRRQLGRGLIGLFFVVLILSLPLCFFPFWDAYFWVDRGDAFLQGGQVDKAVQAYEQAVNLEPETALLGNRYVILAQYHYEQENLQNAIQYSHRASAWDPSNAIVHKWLEHSYTRLGQEKKAEKAGEMYIETLAFLAYRFQNRPGSLNNLAYALAERNQNLETAFSLSLTANKLSRFQDSAYLDTLAWVLYRQGRYQKAEMILRPLVNTEEHPDYFYHYGAVLLAMGREEEGRRYIRQAIDRGLNWWERDEAQSLMSGTARET
jgi:membrane associated rhomboid family serine protease/Flp pilus assembly protein TadD